MNKIKVLIVEDHTMTKLGLQLALDKAGIFEIAGEASDGKKGVELAKELSPDVILMDIGLPVMDGIEATRAIKEQGLSSKVLIFTSRESDEDVFEALSAGADGYMRKGADEPELKAAITAVSNGTGWLDPAIAKLVLSNVKPQKVQEQKSSNANSAKYKEYNLTPAEYEVLKLIADGLDNDDIAKKLVISPSTAKAHVHNLLGKLYVNNKHKAAVLAYKEGLV